MYYDKFLPFYASYSNSLLYSGERMQEKEYEKMKSYYPEMAGRIQEEVERQCELLDYEGSRIYDEYPDHLMLKELAYGIRDRVTPEVEIQDWHRSHLDELIEVLLYQEITRRRCRRHRCRRYYGR